MNAKDITVSKEMAQPALPAYRPRLFLAFLACFVWLVVASHGAFSKIPLPSEVRFLFGHLIPILAAMAILYPTDLFRGRRPMLRVGILLLFSFAVLTCAFVLLFAFAVFLFAVGAVSPE